MDVKLGSMTKVPRIAVNDWDEPEQLARDFCRIYSLHGETVHVLADVILNSMRENNIAVRGDVNDPGQNNESGNEGVMTDIDAEKKAAQADASHRPVPPPPPPPRSLDEDAESCQGMRHLDSPRPPPPRQYRYTDATGETAVGRSRNGDLNSALNNLFLDMDDNSTSSSCIEEASC